MQQKKGDVIYSKMKKSTITTPELLHKQLIQGAQYKIQTQEGTK